MLIWTIDKFVRPGVRGICYEHFYFLGGFSPTIIYAPGNPELLLLIGCHRLGAAADLWTRAVASHGFDVLRIPKNHSKKASRSGRRSISKLHALRSCWMRFQ
jgi:hypothetical protein